MLQLEHPDKMYGTICARKGRLVKKEIWVAGPPYVKMCACLPVLSLTIKVGISDPYRPSLS